MPRGPKGEKRKTDVIGNAVLVARIATGEVSDSAKSEKNAAAVALGKLGGQKGGAARAAKLTPEKRRQIAKKAAAKRWPRT